MERHVCTLKGFVQGLEGLDTCVERVCWSRVLCWDDVNKETPGKR